MSIVLAPFAVGLGVAAAYDLAVRRIPNWLVLSLLCAGLAVRAWIGGPQSLGAGALGALAGAGLLFVPFALGWLGAGDVKLLAASGAWLGPAGALYTALAGLALGGAMAVAFVVADRRLRREVTTNLAIAAAGLRPDIERRARRYTVPLGAALAAGAVLAAWLGERIPHA